ncbi:MAG: hypothetical protein V3T35_11810 [Spirochaetia bacterium]
MRHIIDTNCLLPFVTDRNPMQNECMAAVFERAAKHLKLPVYTFDRAFRRQLERVSILVDAPRGTPPSESPESE